MTAPVAVVPFADRSASPRKSAGPEAFSRLLAAQRPAPTAAATPASSRPTPAGLPLDRVRAAEALVRWWSGSMATPTTRPGLQAVERRPFARMPERSLVLEVREGSGARPETPASGLQALIDAYTPARNDLAPAPVATAPATATPEVGRVAAWLEKVELASTALGPELVVTLSEGIPGRIAVTRIAPGEVSVRLEARHASDRARLGRKLEGLRSLLTGRGLRVRDLRVA